jgi:glycosyltransferase involved in cell wall biosynthesis
MNIAWLTWKDHQHPEAGGAEVVARELTQRLLADGHNVTMLTCGYKGAPRREVLSGVDVIRVGSNRYTHPFQAFAYFMRHMRGKYQVLIEEVNGAPYFSVLFERKAKKYLLYHQMEGPVWFYETKPPLSYLGHYALEPVASRLLARSRTPVVTISNSTASDLVKHGFDADQTHIISEGIEIEPLADLDDAAPKFDRPTILSLGAMRAMKRTIDQIKAFEIAKATMPELQLKIAGKSDGDYGAKVLAEIEASPYKDDIEYLGKVSREQKVELMQRAHLIMQTAVHEGWGLTVTEAASQGTPAVVYNVNGLRDSVRSGETGMVTDQNPPALAYAIVKLLNHPDMYERVRQAAWEWSRGITFDQSYADFKRAIGVEV